MSHLRPLAVLFLLLGGASSLLAQSILRVDQNAPGVVEDGLSWATAYRDLADALEDAVGGDEIWVADGIYVPGSARIDTFELKTGVEVYGGFTGYLPGAEETAREQRDENPETNGTVLSGDINGDDLPNFGNYGDNCYQVVTGTSAGEGSALDGFTVTAGNADEPSNRNHLGGGIICDGGGSPVLRNLLVMRNQASLVGGGMYLNQAFLGLVAVTFLVNRAHVTGSGVTGEGGAVYLNQSNPIFNRCRFLGNTAVNSGGGISNHSSNPQFFSCLFSGNSTEENGGAVYSVTNSSPGFYNCTLYGNRADMGEGGAFYQNGGSLGVLNTVVHQNRDSQVVVEWANITAINGAVVNRTYSFVEGFFFEDTDGNVPGIESIVLPPLFVDPEGPDNQVGTLDDNLRLNAGTQLVNTGDTSLYTGFFANFSMDLDGLPRVVPVEVEIGAYELQTMFLDGILIGDRQPDYELAAPLQTVAVSEDWFPDTTYFNEGEGLEYLFTPLSTTGTLSFSVPPSVDAEGELCFGLVPGTFGSAVFEVTLSDPSGVFTTAIPHTFTINVADGTTLPGSNLQPSFPLRPYIRVFGAYPTGSNPSANVIGEVKFFASDTVSSDYLPADGRLLSIASNTALFSILGTIYGGDGEITFALPDLRGRVAIGVGHGPGLSSRLLGETGGSECLSFPANSLPSHSHETIAGETAAAGSGGTFSKMQSYVALKPIIVLDGAFPSNGGVCGGEETVPYIGEVRWYAGGNFIDWTVCQGQLLPISQYITAFSLLGTAFGGDGETTFGLPDLSGRAAVAVGSGSGLTPRTVGEKFGAETGLLSLATMPAHGHVLPTGGLAKGAGDGGTVDNMMPSIALHHIVCSVTGEVRMMATSSEWLLYPGDGLSGRPDLFGRVVIGESPTTPYFVTIGSETAEPALHEIDGHSHTVPPYLDWMSQFYPNEADPEVVGLFAQAGGPFPNVLQFVLDADPRTFDATILPEFSRNATNVTFIFRRRTDAISRDPFVEFGSTLTGWTRANDGENGVTILEEFDGFGPGVDRVTVTIPHGGATELFARLRIDGP